MFAEVLTYLGEVEYISHAMAAFVLSHDEFSNGLENYREEIVRLTRKLSRSMARRTKQMLRGRTRDGIDNVEFFIIKPAIER